jgi:hypothetical protein
MADQALTCFEDFPKYVACNTMIFVLLSQLSSAVLSFSTNRILSNAARETDYEALSGGQHSFFQGNAQRQSSTQT